MRRWLCVLVVITLVFSFAACATQVEDDPTDVTTTTAVATTTRAATTTVAATTTAATTTQMEVLNPFAELMEISFLSRGQADFEPPYWDQVELEEKFNVKLTNWNVPFAGGMSEGVQMMLAAGDVPDFGMYYLRGRPGYEDGLTRTIPISFIEQFFPSYYRHFEIEPIGKLFNRVDDPDDPNHGDFYGLMIISPLATTSGHAVVWRLDWLEDLGWTMDNLEPFLSARFPEWNDRTFFSTTQFSIDEVKDIFRSFTLDDPNNTGQDDTYGSVYANSWYDIYISYGMFGFDTHGSYFYEDPLTGDYVPFFAYTPWRDMFEFVTEMLDMGYMRWVPGEISFHLEMAQVWRQGITGFMNTLFGPRILGYADSLDWPPGSVLDHDPDARFVYTRPPGEGKFRPYFPFNWGTNYDWVVGIDVSDAKLERLFHMIEYSYFGEHWVRYRHGIEGVHFTWANEPYNSPMIRSEEETIPRHYRMFQGFGNMGFVSDHKAYFSWDAWNNQNIDYWNKYNPGGYTDNTLWIRPHKYFSAITMPSDLYDEFVEIRNDTMSDINAVRNEFTSKIWDGQVADLRMEWEQYIQQLYAAGLEDWVRIMNNEEVRTFAYYSGY